MARRGEFFRSIRHGLDKGDSLERNKGLDLDGASKKRATISARCLKAVFAMGSKYVK